MFHGADTPFNIAVSAIVERPTRHDRYPDPRELKTKLQSRYYDLKLQDSILSSPSGRR